MAIKSGVWRACLSDLLLATGMLMLLGGTLMWARSALAAQEVANRRFLVASVPLAVPMPDRSSFIRLAAGLPSPTPESPKRQVALEERARPEDLVTSAAQEEPLILAVQPLDDLVVLPTAADSEIEPTSPPVATTGVSDGSAIVTAVGSTEAPAATQAPPAAQPPAENEMVESNPIVRIEIPAIKVKRAVVPVGLRPDSSGRMGWDTDAIFATNNRQDLVGHLVGSAYPGQGGNIVLIGHNYNQVDLGWEGVFVNIKSLQPGDRIVISARRRVSV
jgi:hypothetical protein